MTTTTQTQRYEAQRALNAAAARRANEVHSALTDLLDVAEHDIRRGVASASVTAAVRNVREAQHG
jgi:hypothetical protein